MVGLGFLFCLEHLGGQRPRIHPIEIIREFFCSRGLGGGPPLPLTYWNYWEIIDLGAKNAILRFLGLCLY